MRFDSNIKLVKLRVLESDLEACDCCTGEASYGMSAGRDGEVYGAGDHIVGRHFRVEG